MVGNLCEGKKGFAKPMYALSSVLCESSVFTYEIWSKS